MKRINAIFLILLCVCSLCFTACNYSTPPTDPLKISGGVYFDNVGLEGVKIKSTTRTLFTTLADGTFNFEEQNTKITIHAEKEGYTFSPKSITLTKDTENVVITDDFSQSDSFNSIDNFFAEMDKLIAAKKNPEPYLSVINENPIEHLE